ncbi:MAG: LacI family transcriptional regulator [Deltaproteobacteria bacterium]|nr:LacI family transcriptional regulator [Deltaproteobacteria bacterium]
MAVTISDIAKSAGVSSATVSRVLNSPHIVKEETLIKVLKAMKEQEYAYNALAGGLARKRTATIGLIIPTITNPIFAISTKGTQTVAKKRGYSILLGSTEYSYDVEFDFVSLFYEKRVDGIIFMGAPGNLKSMENLRKRKIPFVVTWEVLREKDVNFVAFDNIQIARRMTDYLISLGHRRIAMIAGPTTVTTRASQRLEGYRQSLDVHDLPCDETLIVHKNYTVEDGKEAMRRLLRENEDLTAVFCGNDILAFGAMAAAKEVGYVVGTDISIVGFDDLDISRVSDPQLTTVQIPAYQMGKMSGDLLISLIEEEVQQPRQYILDSNLVIRQSAGNPSLSRRKLGASRIMEGGPGA